LAESEHPAHDVVVGGESLWSDLRDTLRVEALRSDPHSRFAASEARERVMKELFLTHYKQGSFYASVGTIYTAVMTRVVSRPSATS